MHQKFCRLGNQVENPQTDEWLTPLEVTAELKIPLATLYAWRSRGQGPRAVRVGRHIRYRRSDVADWLRGLESEERGGAS